MSAARARFGLGSDAGDADVLAHIQRIGGVLGDSGLAWVPAGESRAAPADDESKTHTVEQEVSSALDALRGWTCFHTGNSLIAKLS